MRQAETYGGPPDSTFSQGTAIMQPGTRAFSIPSRHDLHPYYTGGVSSRRCSGMMRRPLGVTLPVLRSMFVGGSMQKIMITPAVAIADTLDLSVEATAES
jgi:hypothetical protein